MWGKAHNFSPVGYMASCQEQQRKRSLAQAMAVSCCCRYGPCAIAAALLAMQAYGRTPQWRGRGRGVPCVRALRAADERIGIAGPRLWGAACLGSQDGYLQLSFGRRTLGFARGPGGSAHGRRARLAVEGSASWDVRPWPAASQQQGLLALVVQPRHGGPVPWHTWHTHAHTTRRHCVVGRGCLLSASPFGAWPRSQRGFHLPPFSRSCPLMTALHPTPAPALNFR